MTWQRKMKKTSKFQFMDISYLVSLELYLQMSDVRVLPCVTASCWSNTTPIVLQSVQAGVTLQHVYISGSRITRPDSLVWLPGFNHITEQRSHLAASPPGRRFDTLGLPSLSEPPEMVRPRLLPSLFIRSTVVTPRYSSADRYRHRHRSAVSISVRLTESPCLRGNERLFSFFPAALTEMLFDTRPHTLFSHFLSLPCSFTSLNLSESLWRVQREKEEDRVFINATQKNTIQRNSVNYYKNDTRLKWRQTHQFINWNPIVFLSEWKWVWP